MFLLKHHQYINYYELDLIGSFLINKYELFIYIYKCELYIRNKI